MVVMKSIRPARGPWLQGGPPASRGIVSRIGDCVAIIKQSQCFERVELVPSISLLNASMRHARLADNSPLITPIRTPVICDGTSSNRAPHDKGCTFVGWLLTHSPGPFGAP